MKKSTLQTIIIVLACLLFCLAGSSCSGGKYCVQHRGFVGYGFIEYRNALIDEGYSIAAATHIAKVELHIIKADKEYIALIED